MNTFKTDYAILSRFSDAVRAIPGIQQRTIPAAQALLVETEKAIAEFLDAGRSYEDALRLCNGMVEIIQYVPTTAELRRWEREERAETLAHIRWEAQANR